MNQILNLEGEMIRAIDSPSKSCVSFVVQEQLDFSR